MASNAVLSNTWFLVGCAIFAGLSILSIILGAVAHSIPAIVAIVQLTSSLQDGEWVEMDGSTGVVRRIAKDA